jgi:hypothetical protein
MATPHGIPKTLTIACIALVGAALSSACPAADRVDVLRGFSSAVECIRGDERPAEWCAAFQLLLERSGSEGTAFQLGANIGFSFCSEPAAEGTGAPDAELKAVAISALRARLRYEALKRQIGVCDADVARLLKISLTRLAAWKARAQTADRDESLVRSSRIEM